MANKNLRLLQGVLTVAIISVLIFIVLFFFFPDVSMKYYGVAFDKEQALQNTMVTIVSRMNYVTEEERAQFNEVLSTPKGKEVVSALLSAASKGEEEVEKVVKSDEFQALSSSIKSSLSPENFDRFIAEASSASSVLFSRFGNEN